MSVLLEALYNAQYVVLLLPLLLLSEQGSCGSCLLMLLLVGTSCRIAAKLLLVLAASLNK